MSADVPRLREVRDCYAWIITGKKGGADNLRARRAFDRLIEQIRADAYARGKADAQQLTGESSYSYQDGPIPPGTMTSRELADTEDD